MRIFTAIFVRPDHTRRLFYGRLPIVAAKMKISLYRARQLSLALLVVAVVDHGHLQADYPGTAPHTSGLLRLGRDLLRRTGGGAGSGAENAAEGISSKRWNSRRRDG